MSQQLTIFDALNETSNKHEIETSTGRFVDLSNPSLEDITLDDIATGLSNTCRFNGQVEFYSVAQHAVQVSRLLEVWGATPRIQLAGLHHDDPEAYLGDVTTPLKALLQPAYGELTSKMEWAIIWALNLPIEPYWFEDEQVKKADLTLLRWEAEALLPSKGKTWNEWGLGSTLDAGDPPAGFQRPWTPSYARETYIARHEYVMGSL